VQTYEDLAAPRLKSQVCVRSGTHPYNLSHGAALIAHDGEAKTEQWARGLVAKLRARSQGGGHRPDCAPSHAGECGVALANSYYVARLMRSTAPEDVKR
jgi:iron(III) transport system substrate-binding protein